MQDVPIKPFLIGITFASFLFSLAIVAFNFETKVPNYAGLEPRYELYEASITENQLLYDSEQRRKLLWTPGNPKVKVADVKQLSEDRWQIVLEKVY